MPVWYINSEMMYHLWMCAGILRQTASSLRLVIWQKVAEDRPSFFHLEPSHWDEAGTRPVQANTEHAASTRGAEGTSRALCCLTTPTAVTPKDWSTWAFLRYRDFSAITFWCSFALPSVHTVGPSGFSCVFKWLRGLQTQQTRNLCDDTIGAEDKGCAISQICKKGWIMERWFKPPKSLCHVCYICLCSNHKDSDWLQKHTEPHHSAWGDF